MNLAELTGTGVQARDRVQRDVLASFLGVKGTAMLVGVGRVHGGQSDHGHHHAAQGFIIEQGAPRGPIVIERRLMALKSLAARPQDLVDFDNLAKIATAAQCRAARAWVQLAAKRAQDPALVAAFDDRCKKVRTRREPQLRDVTARFRR